MSFVEMVGESTYNDNRELVESFACSMIKYFGTMICYLASFEELFLVRLTIY